MPWLELPLVRLRLDVLVLRVDVPVRRADVVLDVPRLLAVAPDLWPVVLFVELLRVLFPVPVLPRVPVVPPLDELDLLALLLPERVRDAVVERLLPADFLPPLERPLFLDAPPLA
jgi:hypothetical protein